VSQPQDDLPLFAWRPPAGEVLVFPAVRRRAFIRKNAAAADRYNQKAALNYILRLRDKHRERLLRLGVNTEQADADAIKLFAALLDELTRLQAGIAS
jgi:hypothetical protein